MNESSQSQPAAWLWRPYLIVFLSSACIMVLELVAARILAPFVGVSLYTWTSIIGVVLAGISLGNYLGGRLADRRASVTLLGGLFVLAGLLSLSALTVEWADSALPGLPLIGQILLLTLALFFLPCVVLGMISPLVAKLAVTDLARAGATVGKLYAAGTAGSIAGTFLTGFVLIAWLGTHTIVWGVAAILILLGGLLISGGRGRAMAILLLCVGASTVAAHQMSWLQGPCTRETNYFCIKVRERDVDGHTVRVLVLDRLVHSYSSLTDPTRLVYGYEQIYADLTAHRAQEDAHLSALFIGGGGYTFPRYMEAVYPGSDLDVIEIDPGVTQVAYDLLGLQRGSKIRSFNEDARQFLARTPDKRYDLILGDAFNDFSVPYHLTTHEFNQQVKAWLAADGFYMINMIDNARGDFLRATIHTLRQSFRHVYVAPAIAGWQQSVRSTFVLIAGDQPLTLARLQQNQADTLLARRLLAEEEVETLLAMDRVVVLTDRYAPVDQMLAPAFRELAPPAE